MKMNCDVIQDLLPLYEEGLCSPASRALVEAHLADCTRCRAQAEAAERLVPPELPETDAEDRAVARSFRKVRRRWWMSLTAMLLVVPMVWMSVNQFRRQGLCFTNLDDILSARRYAAALADGDWERAASLMDYGRLYDKIQEILEWDMEHYLAENDDPAEAEKHYEFNRNYYAEAENMTENAFTDYVMDAYIRDLELLEENGYTFQLTGFEDSYYAEENGGWTIIYGLNVTENGKTHRLSLHILVREGGLSIGAMGYRETPGEALDLAEILFLGYPDE